MANLRDLSGLCVLIPGSTGLIGTALTHRLKSMGCTIIPLTTSKNAENGSVRWNPEENEGFLSPFPIEEHKIDAVIHLGGYPLQPIWSEKLKRRVYDSRIKGARLLAGWLSKLPEFTENGSKRTFISASATGIYGVKPSDYNGPAFVEQDAVLGDTGNFLTVVSRDAESACDMVREKVRVVHPRFGVILDKNGGALQQMLPPFKMCVGGPMGSGQQMFPWASLDDTVDALVFLLRNESAVGPFTIVSPGAQETSQKRFAKALGGALHRPAVVPLPAFVLNLVMGRDAAEAMLLGSCKVDPKALRDAGFEFKDDTIENYFARIFNE